jgi:hypothetical protein
MSLNARVALAAVVALLASPLWLPLTPWLWWSRRRDRRAGIVAGYRSLTAQQARTIAAHAEATLPTPPPGGWVQVARNVDAYLAAVQSPRHWRTLMLLTLLEHAPRLRGKAPLSRLPLAQRTAFLERHMATTRGLLAIPALARQLVRMGYYTDARIAKELGFVTVAQRRAPARSRPDLAAALQKAVG